MEQVPMPSFRKSEEETPFKGIWDRVSDEALEIVKKKRQLSDDSEVLERVKGVMNNSEFQDGVKEGWKGQTISGSIEDDPQSQERRWAEGLAMRILEKIDN